VVNFSYPWDGKSRRLKCIPLEFDRVLYAIFQTFGAEENTKPGILGAITWNACCVGSCGEVKLRRFSTFIKDN